MKRLILPLIVLAPATAHAQNQVSQGMLEWMAWTWQTGIFFGVIATALICMTLWEILKPGGNPRNPGMLGISTTRGDRLFISLLSAAYIHLGWLALISGPLWGATVVSLIWMLVVFRWV